MASFPVNPFSKVNNDTGFGTNPGNYGGRFVNRDGSFNIRKEGHSIWERFSLFHSMLNLPLWKFALVILLSFITINVSYTFIYVMIGVGEFTGMIAKSRWQEIKELYFFSTETFTTVGYGRVNPVGDWANFVASIEAMTGFLSFAVITGLIYGRFARPRAFIAFSDHAVVSPFRGGRGLMFRFVSIKDHHTLSNVDIKVNLAIQVTENGKATYKFYDLALERSHVDSLPMNWTVVHPIDDQSPLKGLTEDDIKAGDLELYVLVRAFDEVYSNTVLQRTSYTYDEIRFDHKFVPMYRESDDGRTTIVELHKLSLHRKLEGENNPKE
jgi:inward rectifier potassium channel